MKTSAMATSIAAQTGFIAALDQSGGSTPDALRDYGIPDDAYTNETEMFDLVHAMRMRVITAPSFTGAAILGTILFEHTMDQRISGLPVPSFLWRERQVVPFLKVDRGREAEADGVRVMKQDPGLDMLLERAAGLGIYGTKMRSIIRLPSRSGIARAVAQQFEVAERIQRYRLMPIIEPEVLLDSPGKAESEALLLNELARHLDTLPEGREVILKLSIPERPDLFEGLAQHPRVARLLALSGGYSQAAACARLAMNHGMVASFSRALLEGLHHSMNDHQFNASLAASIDKIFKASVYKS